MLLCAFLRWIFSCGVESKLPHLSLAYSLQRLEPLSPLLFFPLPRDTTLTAAAAEAAEVRASCHCRPSCQAQPDDLSFRDWPACATRPVAGLDMSSRHSVALRGGVA